MIMFVGRYAIPNSLHPTGEDGSVVHRSRRYTCGVFAVRELSLATDKDEFIFSDRATATNSAKCRGIVACQATCEPLGRAVNDLLGHCSIIVTERYDRVRLDSLKAAVARLDDGQPFKILSTSPDQAHLVESLSSTH